MTTIFDDVVEYLSIYVVTQLKKQGRRTKPILTVGSNVTTQHLHSVRNVLILSRTYEMILIFDIDKLHTVD